MGEYKDKNGTTRVGDFLRSLGDVAKPVLNAAGGLTGQQWLTNMASNITTSQELKEEQKRIAFSLLELDYKDLENAREQNTKIQQSENASWIAKNLPYFFDSFILIVWAAITFYIVGHWVGVIDAGKDMNFSGVVGIQSGITALATMIIQFHRGSSMGSHAKNSMFRR